MLKAFFAALVLLFAEVQPLVVPPHQRQAFLPQHSHHHGQVARRIRRVPAAHQVKPLTSMNLVDRFFRVVKANVNNLLNKWEDPEKVLTQAVEDLQKDLVKIRQSYAEVMATQKRVERQRDQAQELADEWERRARLALEKGDDNLAREALTRKVEAETQVATYDDQLKVQSTTLGQLYDNMQLLDNKISEAKAQKDQMIARARTAKTATKVNDMISSVGAGASSMDALERMKEKVEQLETEAEVAGQLSAPQVAASDSKWKLLESGSKVDDELEKMKSMLAAPKQANAKVVDALPPASAAVEDELNKLKANAA